VLVGGLLSPTVLTLIVVPVLYTFLAPRRRHPKPSGRAELAAIGRCAEKCLFPAL